MHKYNIWHSHVTHRKEFTPAYVMPDSLDLSNGGVHWPSIACMAGNITPWKNITMYLFTTTLLLLLLLLHPFNGLFSRTTWVIRHQKGKPFWILPEQEMMWWQWHQMDHMQIICTSLQTDNHASTSPLKFLQARCPSCRPTNSIKALLDEQCTCLY